MDFWKKLKKEKLLLSVMTMAIVDLLILAIFIVFPLMDYNFKSKETSKSDTENLASNTESELETEDSENVEEEDSGFDGPISDKYNSQGIEGYNTNKGNGGEAAKDTTVASTEDKDDVLIDDNLTTTKDTTATTEEPDSEEENSENSSEELSTESSDSNTTEEGKKTEEDTTEEKITDAPQTSADGSEQVSASEATQ